MIYHFNAFIFISFLFLSLPASFSSYIFFFPAPIEQISFSLWWINCLSGNFLHFYFRNSPCLSSMLLRLLFLCLPPCFTETHYSLFSSEGAWGVIFFHSCKKNLPSQMTENLIKYNILIWNLGLPWQCIKTLLLQCKGVWVQPSIGELRSHRLCDAAKKKFFAWFCAYSLTVIFYL